MVTWGCYFYSNHLNWSVAQNWIKEKALRAPASHVYWNGDFKEGLLEPSSVVTDLKETHLCPTKNTVSLLFSFIIKVEILLDFVINFVLELKFDQGLLRYFQSVFQSLSKCQLDLYDTLYGDYDYCYCYYIYDCFSTFFELMSLFLFSPVAFI